MGEGEASWAHNSGNLSPAAAPAWLTPLVERPDAVKGAYRRRVPADVLAALTAANTAAAVTGARRDAAVLVLFSGPEGGTPGTLPDDADLLVTVRASTLRHHAGQAAFPGGAADPGDDGPVHTALREATEETGIDANRLHPLATLERMFIPPSGFHVVPVLAYSPDPGPVTVVDAAETALVARVPVRAFVNPENRIMVYRRESTRRIRRAGVPAQRDAGVGVHRAGHFRDARRRGLGDTVGRRQRARAQRRNGAPGRPRQLR